MNNKTLRSSLPDSDACLERCIDILHSWELDARRKVVQSAEKPYFTNGVFANDLRDMAELLIRIQGERAQAIFNEVTPLSDEESALLGALQADAPSWESSIAMLSRTSRERAMAAALIKRLRPGSEPPQPVPEAVLQDSAEGAQMTPAMRKVMDEYREKTGSPFPFLGTPVVLAAMPIDPLSFKELS